MPDVRVASALRARLQASSLLESLGVEAGARPDIDELVRRLGVKVKRVKLDGARAQLVVRKRTPRILLSDRLINVQEQRFAIAHELGHWLLAHPPAPAATLCEPRPPVGLPGERDLELEANCFAMGVLMPPGTVHVFHAKRRSSCDRTTLRRAARTPARTIDLTAGAGALRWAERADVRSVAAIEHNRSAPKQWPGCGIARADALGINDPWETWNRTGDHELPIIKHSLPLDDNSAVYMLWVPAGNVLHLCVYQRTLRRMRPSRRRTARPRRARPSSGR